MNTTAIKAQAWLLCLCLAAYPPALAGSWAQDPPPAGQSQNFTDTDRPC